MKVLYRILLVTILIIFSIQVYNLHKHKSDYIKPSSFVSTLYIDYKFNEQEISFIKDAAHHWEESTHNIVKFKLVSLPTEDKVDLRKGILLLKVDSLDPEIILLDVYNGKPTILGFCKNYKPIPYIKIVSSRLTYKNYTTVVEHELGHLIGLEHSDELNTLMYPTIDLGAPTITETDLQQFCHKYNCH